MDSNDKGFRTQSGTEQESNNQFDIKSILNVVWGMRWWIVLSVFIALVIGFCYIKSTRTKYTAGNTIMVVNRDNLGSAETAVLKDITGITKNSKADNEMAILRSRTLMQRVVEQLGLNYNYSRHRAVKSILFDLNAAPFTVVFDGEENHPNPVTATIAFVPLDSLHFRLKSIELVHGEYPFENKEYEFGEEISLWEHNFAIRPTGVSRIEYGRKYFASMTTSLNAAKGMQKKLTVATVGGKSYQQPDVISLSYVDVLPQRCEAILDALVFQYNEDARGFRNKSTTNTIKFLDERLESISKELSQIEGQYQRYRRSNTVVNVDAQSSLTLNTDQQYEAQLNEVNLQIELLGIIRDYIEHMNNARSVIPANIGIADTGLNATINQYNTLVMERNRMAASSSESNPLVISADSQINELLVSIRASVKNLEKSYGLQKSNIQRKLQEGKRRISNIPEQQLALSTFERQQQIKEPLYILLQQKKEEAMIALYSVSDQCKIVDPADHTAYPSAPNKKMIMLLMFLLGFIIPPGWFYLKQALRVSVDGKTDIITRTSLPVIASIPLTKKADELIRPAGRDPHEEAIRVLRSNFRYYPYRVYQVLSSSPGEGKTYISANIAASLAHAGKKVLLVGVDLRKPRLGQMFGIKEHTHGVVSYLIRRTDEIEPLIHHDMSGVSGLDVIFAGSVPPNPSELIETERMKEFIEHVKQLPYDYILFDSSPYLPVADSVVINSYVDANLLVVRSGVTALKFVSELDSIVANGKLKNVTIVLNGIDMTSHTYGYSNGYGYGHYGYGGYGGRGTYGYGYGYGYGFDEAKLSKKMAPDTLKERILFWKRKKSEKINPEHRSSSSS